MQELAFWAVDTSARAMEELRSESDGQSEASVAPSDQSVGYDTSGDEFDQEQVAGCESCGESDCEDVSSEADEDAATDADAAQEDIPACSMCFVPLDLTKLVTAKDNELLTCDGMCGRDMPWHELRFHCVGNDCDFDLCIACAGFNRRERLAAQPASPSESLQQSPQAPSSPLLRAPQSPAPHSRSYLPSPPLPPPLPPHPPAGDSEPPRAQTGSPPQAEASPEVTPIIALPAAPPVNSRLIAALVSKMAGRSLTRSTRGERATAAFVEWQAEKATARRGPGESSTAIVVAEAPMGLDDAQGDAAMVMAPPERRDAPGPSCTIRTPGTDYVLPAPPHIALHVPS